MSWISERRLASLVTSTMLDQSLPEGERKVFEAELRYERANAINFGDCVVSLLSQTCGSQSIDDSAATLCLAIAMMLEGMINDGWREGASFSDKPMVLNMLDQLLNDLLRHSNTVQQQQQAAGNAAMANTATGGRNPRSPLNNSNSTLPIPAQLASVQALTKTAATLRKLHNVVSSCMVKICVVEFPSDVWTEFIEGHCRTLFESNEAISAIILVDLCGAAFDNPELWAYLTTTVMPRMIPSDGGISTTLLQMVHKLMAHKPPSSQVPDASRNAFLIPESSLARLLFTELCNRDTTFLQHLGSLNPDSRVPPELNDEFTKEKLLVGTLWRFPHTPEVHNALLELVMQRLSLVSGTYTSLAEATLQDTVSFAIVAYCTELLECAQCVFIMSHESFTVLPAFEIFNLLLPFLVDVFDVDGVGSDEQLLSDALDEDAVPAGCASGSPSNLSTSILQLFIEFDKNSLLEFASCWHDAASKVSTDDIALYCRCWYALGMALSAMVKQCDVDGVSILDTVPDAADVFLSSIGQVLSGMNEVPSELTARLLTVLGGTMKLSQNIGCCRQALRYVVDVIEAHTDDRPINITSAAVLATSKVLSASTQTCASLSGDVPFSVFDAAMWVSCNGGALGTYCGATALTILTELCPQWNDAMVESGRLSGVVQSLVRESANIAFSQLLNKFLRTLIDEVKTPAATAAIASLCDLVLQDAMLDATNPSSRVVAELLQLLCLEPNYAQHPVTPSIADYVSHVAMDGPHGDALLRCFAVALGTFAATPSVYDVSFQPLLLEAGQKLVHEAATVHTNTATLSTVALAFGTMVIRLPHVAAEVPTLLSEAVDLIMEHASTRGKDFNYVGACFLAAATAHVVGVQGWIAEVERRAGDDHGLQALADFMSLWATLLPLADRRTQAFTVTFWVQLIERLMDGRESAAVAHFFSAGGTVTMRRVRSVNTKMAADLPAICVSVIDALRVTMAIIGFERDLGVDVVKLVTFLHRDSLDDALSLGNTLPQSAVRDEILEHGVFVVAARCVSNFQAVFPAGSLDANLRELGFTSGVESMLQRC